MGRKLKFHEQKLLKKTNLYSWKNENNKSGYVIGLFCLENSDEYQQYNRLVGKMQRLTNTLRQMPPEDKVRIELTKDFVDRVYQLGIIKTPQLSACADINVASICQRRLPVVMVRLKFCQRIKDADLYVRQGHVRVGADIVTNPATIVSREMEDYIQWAHGSKIEEHVKKFNKELDDFDENA